MPLANPLPPERIEGDSGETDVWDDNDTPPGYDGEGNPVAMIPGFTAVNDGD